MREFEVKPGLEKALSKLKKVYLRLVKKIEEIVNADNIDQYKHLRYDMKQSQRVHIGSFVLVLSYDESEDFVSFEDFQHHDKIYR